MYMRLLEPDQISHTQSMVAERGLTNWANVHTPMWKSHLKHSTAETKWNKNADNQVWHDVRGDQKLETFWA